MIFRECYTSNQFIILIYVRFTVLGLSCLFDHKFTNQIQDGLSTSNEICMDYCPPCRALRFLNSSACKSFCFFLSSRLLMLLENIKQKKYASEICCLKYHKANYYE